MAVGSYQVTLAGSFPPLKGISGYCTSLGRALSKHGSVTGLTFSRMYPGILYPGGSETDPSQEPAPFEVCTNMTWYNPFSWIAAGLRLPRGILHIQHWSLPLFLPWLTLALLARLRGRKVIVTLHNTRSQDGSPLLALSNRVLGRVAHKLVVHAEPLLDELGGPARKACVIPHGLMDTFEPSAMTREEARAELGLPAAGKILLFFGSIRPYKGLEDLLAAFRILKAQDPTRSLLVAGRPWKPLRLEEESGVHTLLDFVPSSNVPLLYRAADLAVLPYRNFHGQSGVGLTALALGIPLVVTNCGGLSKLAVREELVARCGNSNSLATSLEYALEHLEELHIETRQHAMRFSWDLIADDTSNLYREVLGG